jgi:YegS/Rv2252/BmrU family lipid kinase
MKKVLLFYNPHSGNGVFGVNLDRVILEFQKHDLVVTPLRADYVGLLDKFLDEEDLSQYVKFIAAGGDGTVNAMAAKMISRNLDIPLAIFPAGTANDLAHYFDMPEGIDQLLEIATGEHYTKMDVGMVNGRSFVNVLAMGRIVDVSQKTDPGAKENLGIMAYYLRGLADVPKLKPYTVKITTPELSEEISMYAMLVMNGRSAGGFRRAAPDAVINDGLLDVMIFKDANLVKLVPMFLSLLAGQHSDNKNVLYLQTPSIRIESDEDISTDVDGEKGEKLPLDIRVLPDRLTISTLYDDMEGNVW